MYFIYRNRDDLNNIKNLFKYGFLYQEYKLDSWYWEVFKVIMRVIVAFFINFFKEYHVFNGVIIWYILFFYSDHVKKK